jgi:hypothetical protein
MQLNIVVDEKGDVVGTFRSEIRGTNGEIIRAGISPKPGHSVHQIDVDEKIMEKPATAIHEEVQKIAVKQLGQGFYLKKTTK